MLRAKRRYLVVIRVGVTFIVTTFDKGELIFRVHSVFHGRWIEEVVPVALCLAASHYFKVS